MTKKASRKQGEKCIVLNCTNRTSEGKFIGELCAPCHSFIVEGQGRYSQIYRNALRMVVSRYTQTITDRLAGDMIRECDPTGLTDDDLASLVTLNTRRM